MVPVNDQPADQFIKNFLNAIKKPTRRVWLDSEMKTSRAKVDAEAAKEQAKKNLEEDVKRPKIIGSSKIGNQGEKINDKGMDLLEGTTTATPQTADTKVKVQQKTFAEKQLVITPENISKFQFDINGVEKLPGNINLWISNKEFLPVSDVVVQLYDKDKNMLYANKTQSNGYFLTNKIFEEGVYFLKLSSHSLQFPNIKIALNKGNSKKPIKITAL